jgi:hypothetical protein
MSKYSVVEGTLTALTPIFTGGDEKTGSTPVLRTIMIYNDELGEVAIPYISGNSYRGRLRRIMMIDLLYNLGYEIHNPKLHHSLFSGGVLESTDENTGMVDLELRKRIRNLIPPVALLGGCFGNQLIAGSLVVEHLWPICREYKQFLPDEYQKDPRAMRSIREFTDQSFITRRDEIREERKEGEQAVQMKVDYECFVPGTKFYHRFIIQMPDELQKSCLGRALELFEIAPFIGGRSAQGDGKVLLSYKQKPNGGLYLEFLQDKKDDITKLLQELEETL